MLQPLLTLDSIALRCDQRLLFANTRWTWRHGEQWTILGPNGSGKSLLARALQGEVPVTKGEIHYQFEVNGANEAPLSPEDEVVLLSPHVHREFMTAECSFYQSRWHSGIGEGERTVSEFLSQQSVERVNPFEVSARPGNPAEFRDNRRRFVGWLGIENLLRRKLICLSNGEQRKVLLAHTLLRSPRLLILDDPFGGLDVSTRARLKTAIEKLRQGGLPVLLITSRPDEIPASTTHVLLVKKQRVVAQGPKRAMLASPLARCLAAAEKNYRSPAPKSWLRKSTPQNSKPLVELNQVTVQFGKKRILDDLNWTMRHGENWALLGPNGSGKTTLLSLIQGDNPQAYALDIRLFGLKLQSTQSLWQCRQRIGWLSPELHLHYPTGWCCLDVVCSGYFNTLGLFQPCAPHRRARARKWLSYFGLEEMAQRPFGELSLGDQRLVLLARAVVKNPRLLILDEACQGLDAGHRLRVLETVDRVVTETGVGLIFVTHHAKERPTCVTHVLRLKNGRIMAAGPRPINRSP